MEGALNVTGEEEPGHGLWNWDYLITCFAQERVCVSFGLWLLSFLFWLTSSILHFYLRCKRKSSYEESVFWDIYAFFGSMCNTIGALLSKQLTIQVITGGFTALADIIHFILTLFPVCSSTYRVRSGHRKFSARRKHRASLSALCLLIFMGVGCSSLRSCANLPVQVPHTPQRRLLGTVLQESTDIVGFTLGIIAVFVAWTVRVPVITKVCRGMIFSVIQIWAVLFSAVASLLYAAAIMSHDRHPEYFVKAIPWFLISLGAAALDVALTFLSCMMKNKLVRQMGFVVEDMGTTDTCELLTHDDDDYDEVATKDGHKVPEEQEKSSWMPLHMVANDRAVCNKTPLARYVRLSIEQVQEAGFGEVRLPGDGQTNVGSISTKEPFQYIDLSMYPPAQVYHGKVSSSTSGSEMSSSNTELEWDFEDLTSDWKKDAGILYIAPNDSCVMNGNGKEN